MLVRVFDLIPFVAIGWATDFYSSGGEGLPNVLIELAGDRPEIFFGVLIFLGFAFLACFQGLSDYLWQSTAYRIQHDLRMDATRSLMAMEASTSTPSSPGTSCPCSPRTSANWRM